MSNTELPSNEQTPTVDDLAGSLTTENVVISTSDQAMSEVDSEVKQTTLENNNNEPSKEKDFHLIKWIEFNFDQLPILLQNVNGPCPLLAIFNVLLLRKQVNILSIKLYLH
jgi:hypothetical protein